MKLLAQLSRTLFIYKYVVYKQQGSGRSVQMVDFKQYLAVCKRYFFSCKPRESRFFSLSRNNQIKRGTEKLRPVMRVSTEALSVISLTIGPWDLGISKILFNSHYFCYQSQKNMLLSYSLQYDLFMNVLIHLIISSLVKTRMSKYNHPISKMISISLLFEKIMIY